MGYLVSSTTARYNPAAKKRIELTSYTLIEQKLSMKEKAGGHNSAAAKIPQTAYCRMPREPEGDHDSR